MNYEEELDPNVAKAAGAYYPNVNYFVVISLFFKKN